MAHLWINDGPAWRPWQLDSSSVELSGCGPQAAAALRGWTSRSVVVLPTPTDRWVLLTGGEARVRVNGLPIAGIRILEDRDEIRVWSSGGATFFYSSERQASIEPYQGNPGAVCPRCQQGIDVRTPGVRCPRCAVWHHETGALACWTYDDKCAVCSDATRLNAPYKWQPEALWNTIS